MNELIKELAIEAGFRSDVTVSDGQGNHIVTKTEQSLEKFAELIVKQCAYEAEVFTASGVGDYIKSVFGVKNEP